MNFKNILILTDITTQPHSDEKAIKMLAPKAENIYALHVMQQGLKDLFVEIFGDDKDFGDHYKKCCQSLQEWAQGFSSEITCIVNQGSIEDIAIKTIKDKEIDLVVTGIPNFAHLGGHYRLIETIVMNSPCSLIMVPTGYNCGDKPTRVLVPIDFEKSSELALKFARQVVEKDGTITILNAYNVPDGYWTLGQSFDKAKSIMRKMAQNKMTDFLDKINDSSSKEDIRFLLSDPAEAIVGHAEMAHNDLVVMGSYNRTVGAKLFHASTSKKVIQKTSSCTLILKDPDLVRDFLDEY